MSRNHPVRKIVCVDFGEIQPVYKILFDKLFVLVLAIIMVLSILFGKKFVLIAPKLPKTMHSVREIVCGGHSDIRRVSRTKTEITHFPTQTLFRTSC